jgi:hypothetical protein
VAWFAPAELDRLLITEGTPDVIAKAFAHLDARN